MKKHNEELENGQCTKDSDCGIGEVCSGGRCIPDITPPPPGTGDEPPEDPKDPQ